MGFGTLFFGYFILLDLPYQTLTNVCAAALILLGLYKLAYLNENMKRALYTVLVFLPFALYEATVEVLGMFFFIKIDGVVLNTVTYMVRNVIIGLLSAQMLFGMRDVAEEVGLRQLSRKCDIYSKITLGVYVLNLTVPPDFSIIFGGEGALYTQLVLSVITTLLTLYVIIMNCFNIYACYSKICMPEDNKSTEQKDAPSRFGFVNAFRKHEEEKRREYAEYKLQKMKKRAGKRKK